MKIRVEKNTLNISDSRQTLNRVGKVIATNIL